MAKKQISINLPKPDERELQDIQSLKLYFEVLINEIEKTLRQIQTPVNPRDLPYSFSPSPEVRTLDVAGSASPAGTRDVLGTLLYDLNQSGIIGD